MNHKGHCLTRCMDLCTRDVIRVAFFYQRFTCLMYINPMNRRQHHHHACNIIMEWIRILFPWTILGIVIVGCYYDGFPITEEQVCKSSVYMMQSVEAPMITFTQRSWPEMYFDFEVRWKWHDQVHRTQYINHTSVVIHLDHVLNFTKQDFIEISWYNRSHYEDHGIYGGPYFDLTLKTRSDQSIPSNGMHQCFASYGDCFFYRSQSGLERCTHWLCTLCGECLS